MKQLITFVELEGKEYLVSTTNTFDMGLETMVFESCNQRVINWFDLYVRHYDTVEEATEGHNEIVENIKNYI